MFKINNSNIIEVEFAGNKHIWCKYLRINNLIITDSQIQLTNLSSHLFIEYNMIYDISNLQLLQFKMTVNVNNSVSYSILNITEPYVIYTNSMINKRIEYETNNDLFVYKRVDRFGSPYEEYHVSKDVITKIQ